MPKIFLTLLLICLSKFVTATTIVIYITPDLVIMAADSKGVFTDAGSYKQSHSIVSKIYKTGAVYFSIAGLTSNAARSFDVGQLTNKSLKNAKSLNAGIENIKTSVSKALVSYLQNQKKNNYTLFKRNLPSSVYITSIGFITIHNNQPYACLLGFKVTDGTQLKIDVHEEVYTATSNRDAVYYLGTSGEINKYMNTIKSSRLKPVDFVDKLMNLQIAKTPGEVGYPVDMIKLTTKESTWIRRKKSTPIEIK
jgi:hypothetical protein